MPPKSLQESTDVVTRAFDKAVSQAEETTKWSQETIEAATETYEKVIAGAEGELTRKMTLLK